MQRENSCYEPSVPTKQRARPRKRTSTKKPRVSTHPARVRTAESKRLIARLQPICMALPGTTEQIAWGEPTWRVRGKIFAQLDDHHHGSGHVSVWLPAPDGAQAALIDAEPDRIFRPPYVGHKGWIAVILDGDCDWAMVEALVAQAHGLIAAKR
jgi:predicted DNA-binding protein (MmcQ/YjbR family)